MSYFDFSFSYWVWIGSINLLMLTIEDYKNKLWVDDRHNWVMLGLSISLISHFKHSIFFLLALSVISGLLLFYLSKILHIGEADKNALLWLFIGLAIISLVYLIIFLMIFAAITFIYFVMFEISKKVFNTQQKEIQYFGVILLSFVILAIFYNMY
jgi:hypothetical protein